MEGCLFIIILIIIISALVGIWSFVFWIGLQKILTIIVSFFLVAFLFVLLGLLVQFIQERSYEKKRTIDIIQHRNIEKFKRLIDNFNNLKKYLLKPIHPLLCEINDIEKINILCQECFKNRNPLLVKLIVDKQWIASQPASAKVYTILKNNQLKLIENSDGEEVKYLLDSLKDKDPEIANRAKQSLEEIRIINQHGIDYLCQEWLLKEKDQFLESLIIKYQYQALSPVRVKILTAFLHQQLSLVRNEGEEGVQILLSFLQNQDTNLASNSLKVLYNLTNHEGINYLCQQWANHRDKQLEAIIISKKYLATSPLKVKILTAFLNQQLSLIKNEGEEGVQILLSFLQNQDTNLASNSLKVLYNLTNQEGINYLCQQWANDKGKQLEAIIISQKYLATFPVKIKILTAFLNQQLSLIKNEGEEGVQILLSFLQNQDTNLASNSLKVLYNLTNQEGIDYLCQQWANDRDKKLERIIILKQYYATFPSDVKILTALKTGQLYLLSNLNLEETIILINTLDDSDQVIVNNIPKMGDFLQDSINKCLIYFITEQWEQYERIDFDQSLLKNVFYHADSSLRKRIAEKIKISGRSDWLQVIFAERKRKNIELMTDYDWQVTVELLRKTDNDREKWKLAQQAPPFYSQRLLKQIQSLNFTNRKKLLEQHLLNFGKKVIPPPPSDYAPSINDNPEIITIFSHTDSIISIVINSEGTLLASASDDRTIKLWDLPSGRLLNTLTGHTNSITSLVMNREETLLASASDDRTIKLWELSSGRLLHIHTLKGHTSSIRSLVINNPLLSNSESTIKK
ncbi:hypothetical protein VKI21_12220 [Cyanobacterium aponinum UTEX 3222]|uniref:hypothetical protein n=1 Tax=Cyanobacterium aponinum TaxID=379064 RepID=UPI003085782D|nr:hypothetical protein VKI21_12220 [Cyanobacterium aponinum UTEX 3222]